MFIEPSTDIRILIKCPLDNTYEHTLYFSSAEEQTNYFIQLAEFHLPAYSYQRVNRNSLRVEIPVEKANSIYRCNYIMFKNSAFQSKWFYAFITGVNYINNITYEIEYELDVMQTWLFDYKLQECFIEREHSATDKIGDNLIPENLELGDYIIRRSRGTGFMEDFVVCVATTTDKNNEPIDGAFYNRIYNGTRFVIFDTNTQATVGALNDFIKTKTKNNQADSIVGIWQLPKFALLNGAVPNSTPVTKTVQLDKYYRDIDGYVPRNKKLFTYPYNLLQVTDYNGNSQVYKYEYFDKPAVNFQLTGCTGLDTTVVLSPVDYKRESASNYNEKMSISNFPQCAYTIDSYLAYIAQVNTSMIPQTLANSLNTIISKAVTGGMAGGLKGLGAGALYGTVEAGGNLLQSVSNMVAGGYEASHTPPQTRGGSSNSANMSMQILDFHFLTTQITSQFARIIDDYFDKFGYATHRLKKPNIAVRPHWCYTKTVGCTLTGSVPAEDMNKICHIFDNGITFWKKGNEVGNYSLNNSI